MPTFERSLEMIRIKIANLNVHSWTDAKGKNSRTRLQSLLENQNLDVAALQETKPKRKFNGAIELANALKFPYCIQSGEMAIVSKHKVTLEASPIAGGLKKRTLFAKLHLPSGTINICNVHLDYRCEGTRENEMRSILACMRACAPSIILGDFNALSRSDCGSTEWARVAAVRRQNAWEEPAFQLLEWLSDDKAWSDCRRILEKSKVVGRNGTSRFGTRVDYCFVNESFRENFTVRRSLHVETKATDHSLVVTTFERSEHRS